MKADNNILLALLQDISGDKASMAGSTAAIAEADIKKDGLDKNDIYEIAGNAVIENPLQKVWFTFGNHPELLDTLSEYAGIDITPYLYAGRLDMLSDLITDYLEEQNIQTFGQGGQFNSDLDIVPVKIGNKTYKLLANLT